MIMGTSSDSIEIKKKFIKETKRLESNYPTSPNLEMID